MTATLANMIVTGCQMHANVFTMMGKGTPEFTVKADGVDIVLSDGTYTVTITHAEPVAREAPPAA